MAKRKTKGRGWTAVVLISLLAGLLSAAYLKENWSRLGAGFDGQVLTFERLWRKATVRAGLTLPGTPDLKNLDGRLAEAGHNVGDPIFMRIFKREFELELWLRRDGRFHHFATYPICKYSGWLGPKLKQGDRQAPEGIYTVSSRQLNPNSRWHRSFNLGFPNAYDKSQGRTGTFLMVHGGCSSIGCYAMTNDVVDEIWTFVTAALSRGQKRFQVQVFPFRMTQENLDARSGHRWAGYWRQIKSAHDLFEATKVPPKVTVCKGRYIARDGDPKQSSASSITQNCADAREMAAQ